MNRINRDALIGAAIGGLASGVGGYFITDRKKGRGRRIRNALLSMLAGGAVGGLAGGVLRSEIDYRRAKSRAERLPPGEKAVPGRVYYVDYPHNGIDSTKTGFPLVDSTAGAIKSKTGWDGNLNIGHSGILVVDRDGNAERLDYGMFGGEKPELLRKKFNFRGKSESEIANILRDDSRNEWGDRVVLNGTDVADIGVARRYMEGMLGGDADGFGFLPLQNSCGKVSREAFDSARKSGLGHILDYMSGGFPSANRPVYGTRTVSSSSSK